MTSDHDERLLESIDSLKTLVRNEFGRLQRQIDGQLAALEARVRALEERDKW